MVIRGQGIGEKLVGADRAEQMCDKRSTNAGPRQDVSELYQSEKIGRKRRVLASNHRKSFGSDSLNKSFKSGS
jgi:hypothetical protein